MCLERVLAVPEGPHVIDTSSMTKVDLPRRPSGRGVPLVKLVRCSDSRNRKGARRFRDVRHEDNVAN